MANPQALPLVPTAPQALGVGVASIASGMSNNALLVKHEGERIAEQDQDSRLQLSEFKFPPPPRASPDQMQAASADAVDRMFEIIDDFEKTSLIARKNQLGVNRLAASSWDREGWTSLIIRIATRGSTDDFVRSEEHESTGVADYIRERLYQYISQDFRRRLDVAIAWLNEEWYNDKIMAGLEEGAHREPQYQKWMMRLMDGIIPFLEGKDRIFMRMLSEIPEVPRELLEKIKIICLDPDRVTLGIQMLQ
jgi:symplekin